ncbi:SDR family NAD(P)-dependent oxidoreductase [Spongiactinospora sp. 9N601]|uniref:SDR family NAD(P)-dependent oxidoreductase n=1 Tax=Spongiactinospora sp. 9N601 TaxID=3375149 RepID=UPI0037BB4889
MADPAPRTLVLSGASGTVGTALLHTLAPRWPGDLLALGRTSPWAPVSRPMRFTPVDLADTTAVAEVSERIASRPAVSALVCAAGVDARASLQTFDVSAARTCAQVNAWANVQLLHAALASQANASIAPRAALPVVLVSTDVIGISMPATLVYAAAKAAAEEAFRHAYADADPPGIALLIVRLPDIGLPMRSAVPGPPPPACRDHPPRPALSAAVDAITTFLLTPRPATVEAWHA